MINEPGPGNRNRDPEFGSGNRNRHPDFFDNLGQLEEEVALQVLIYATISFLTVWGVYFLLEILKVWSAYKLVRVGEKGGANPTPATAVTMGDSLYWRKIHIAWFTTRFLRQLVGGSRIDIFLIFFRGCFIFPVNEFINGLKSEMGTEGVKEIRSETGSANEMVTATAPSNHPADPPNTILSTQS